MGRKAKARFGIAITCAFGTALAFAGSASAGTVTTHPFVSSFTPPPSAAPKGFSPGGIAVDQSKGKVYVADIASDAVDIFSAAGTYLGQLDDSSAPRPFLLHNGLGGITSAVADIAVDNSGGASSGRVYVTTQGQVLPQRSDIYAFSSNGTYLPSFSENFSGVIYETAVPCGLAVDSHGNVAVSPFDQASMVPVVNSSGTRLYEVDTRGFLGFLDPNSGLFARICGLAYDSADDLYVRSIPTNLVARFDPTGQFERLIGTAPGAFAVEVDRSSDDLYVDDDQGSIISQYDSSGTLLNQFGLGKFNNSAGISLNESSGNVYVADPAHSRVAVFGPPASLATPDVTAEAATDVTDTTATFNGTVHSQGLSTHWRFQFKRHKTKAWQPFVPAACVPDPKNPGQFTDPLCDPDCPVDPADPENGHPAFCSSPAGNTDIAASLPVAGLSQNTTYDVRMQAADAETGAFSNSNVVTFTTEGKQQADLTIDPASSITSASAHVTGTVDPNGTEASWRFQYTTDDTFEEDWIDVAKGASAGSGESPVAVSSDLTGLTPSTHYFVRLIGTNAGGPKASVEIELTTVPVPPLAQTRAAAVPTETATTLGGVVNPQNAPTTYWFEYGPTESYGASLPATQDAGAGSKPKDLFVRQDLSGLEAATEYHFRIAAHNAAGITLGKDMTFATVDPDKGPPQRGIELVSNPDKGNQSVSFWSPALAPDGNRVLWGTIAGAPGSPSGAVSAFLAERSAMGWQSRSLLPELGDGLVGDSSYAYYVERYNTDFTRFVASAVRGLFTQNASDRTLVRLDDQRHQEILHVFPAGVGMLDSADASADLSHVFVGTGERIVAAHAPKTFNIYDFGSGTPVLVSRLPNGTVPSCGVERPFYRSERPRNSTSAPEGESPEWISTDGSRVFFLSSGTGACTSAQLYVRDLSTSTTTLISEPPLAVAPGAAHLIRAAADGRSAIFATTTRLVSADTNTTSDIYRWDESAPTACLSCGASPAGVIDAIASRDLSHVYFTSKNQLVPGEGKAGELSLYVWHGDKVDLDYVAPSGNLSSALGTGVKARLTAGGNVLLFAGTEGASGDRFYGSQLYRYEDSSRRLLCISCRAQGEPVGGSVGMDAISAQMSADGKTVAFVTGEALLRRDVNHASDLYEWREGRIALVTDGEASTFGDVLTGALTLEGITPDGRDILFTAAAKYAPGVLDPYSQAYDARAGGGFPASPTPPARCEGDACQGPLSPVPGLAHPGSSSMEGPANEAARAKKKAKHRKGKHPHQKKRHGAKREGRRHG